MVLTKRKAIDRIVEGGYPSTLVHGEESKPEGVWLPDKTCSIFNKKE